MQSNRHGLEAAMRLLGRLGHPAEEKFGAAKAHRAVLARPADPGLVSILGPGGLFYDSAVGAFGVFSSAQNWGLLSSASHRWALALIDNRKFYLLFPRAAL